MKSLLKLTWPGIIFVLIGANFCIVAITVVAANSGKSFAFTEPDYYNAAVHWDETSQERADSDKLGWSVVATVSDSLAQLAISDREGRPVSDSAAQIEYFSLLNPADRKHANVRTDSAGVARIPGTFPHANHEFRVRMTTSKLTFVRVLRTGE